MIDVTVMVWHLYLFGYLLVVYVCVIIVQGSRSDLCKRFTCMVVHTYSSSCAFMPSICSGTDDISELHYGLLSICRGKLHRQVHVCDLLISYKHSPSTFTAVHPCCIPWSTFRRSWIEILQDRLHSRAAACIGSENETAMASDLG